MSIIIKGMEMPKNCDECFFVGRGFPDWCSLPQIPKDEDEIDDTNNRPDWCPLEELPSAQPVDKDMNVPCTDTISRQAAIRWVKTECNPYGKPTLDFESGKKVIEHLKQMPSAQPELIRCKDCKYNSNPPEYGNACCDTFYGMTDQMGFCHMAERREDETD